MTTLLTTKNEGWGFYGTMYDEPVNTEHAWNCAMTEIQKATATGAEEVRAFLDSRMGRHFANEVCDQLFVADLKLEDAIKQAVKTWSEMRVSRLTRKHFGIPAGVNYLTGMVITAHIESES